MRRRPLSWPDLQLAIRGILRAVILGETSAAVPRGWFSSPLLVALLILVAACGTPQSTSDSTASTVTTSPESGTPASTGGNPSGSQIEITDDELAIQIPNWPNFIGLGQIDPDVWRQRLQRSCAEGVWDHEVAERLAAEFIQEDLPLSVRGDDSVPETVAGAQALWLMARNSCGELVPPGTIEKGPPGRSG